MISGSVFNKSVVGFLIDFGVGVPVVFSQYLFSEPRLVAVLERGDDANGEQLLFWTA